MKITSTDTEIIFTFPRFAQRYNCYDEDNDYGDYPTFTGLIVRKSGDSEMGFAGTIDMTYSGKPDQVSDFIVMWHGNESGFREKCKELGLNIHEI